MDRVLLNSENGAELGIINKSGEVYNPSGFSENLLKILPEVISIPATADTVQELADKSTTALGKLKKEVMGAFFQELAGKTKTLLADLDSFLHSQEEGVRASAISDFEKGLKEEFMGEFTEVVPSVEFGLPDETVIYPTSLKLQKNESGYTHLIHYCHFNKLQIGVRWV